MRTGPKPIPAPIGQRFGKLVVIEEIEPKADDLLHRHRRVKCLCDCGNEAIVPITNFIRIRTGKERRWFTKSCGCLNGVTESNIKRTKHGHSRDHSRTTEHGAWTSMLDRCLNPKARNYASYGGRGITVCESWVHSFETFLMYVGLKSFPNYTLDRIDNSRGYEPENVRWTTWDIQVRNRRSNRWLTVNGETLTIGDWATRL